jgi:hypothetical protein
MRRCSSGTHITLAKREETNHLERFSGNVNGLSERLGHDTNLIRANLQKASKAGAESQTGRQRNKEREKEK